MNLLRNRFVFFAISLIVGIILLPLFSIPALGAEDLVVDQSVPSLQSSIDEDTSISENCRELAELSQEEIQSKICGNCKDGCQSATECNRATPFTNCKTPPKQPQRLCIPLKECGISNFVCCGCAS